MTYKRRLFDADFKVLNTGIEATQVNTNTINEKTAASGVTIDSVLLKDGVVKDGTGTQLSTVQDIQNASADKASYYFDGASYVSGDAQILGTSALTILTTFKTVKSSASAAQMLLKLGAAIGGEGANNTVGVIIETDNKVKMNYYGSSNAESSTAIEINKYYTAIGVYSGSTLKMYLNGIAGTEVNYSTGNLANNKLLIGKYGASSLYFNGSIGRSIVFNYALSAEKVTRYSAGAKLDFEDVGGSMVDKISGLSWTNISFDTQSIAGKAISSLSGGQYDRADIIGIGKLEAGKTYRVYYNSMTSTPANTLSLSFLTAAQSEASAYMLVTQASGYVDIVATLSDTNGRLMLQARYGSLSSGSMTIDKVVQLGAVLDLEPENITDGTWFDASPNGLHGTVTGAVAQRFTPSYDSRNYIINGGMDFWQRGDFSSPVVSTSSAYRPDRFITLSGVVTSTTEWVTAGLPSGFSKACKVVATSTSSSTSSDLEILTKIDNLNILLGKTVTFSAWVKSNTSRACLISRNWGPSGVLAFDYHSGSGNYERLTITYKVEDTTSAGPDAYVYLYAAVVGPINSGDYIEATGFMLNEGPVAAPFQRAGGTIGSEELLCKRYYLDLTSSMLTFNMQFPAAYVNTTDAYLTPMLNAVPMAKIPTLEQSGLTGVKSCTIGGAEVGTVTNLVLANATKESYLIKLNGTGFGPTGTHVFLGSSGKLALNAEI